MHSLQVETNPSLLFPFVWSIWSDLNLSPKSSFQFPSVISSMLSTAIASSGRYVKPIG